MNYLFRIAFRTLWSPRTSPTTRKRRAKTCCASRNATLEAFLKGESFNVVNSESPRPGRRCVRDGTEPAKDLLTGRTGRRTP